MSRGLDQLTVVVPACNEETTIDGCLEALDAAAAEVRGGVDGWAVEVTTVVVVNGTWDDTAEAVERHRGVQLLHHPVANVGAARAAGARWAIEHHRGELGSLWLASTDADSVVPRTWLQAQLDAAQGGADAYLGTIRLDDEHVHAQWSHAYASAATRHPTHGHVHGASLGVRASTYLAVGGFRPLAVHEDADLVHRLKEAGTSIVWDAANAVTTSARHDPRAVGGVGSDLAASAG